MGDPESAFRKPITDQLGIRTFRNDENDSRQQGRPVRGEHGRKVRAGRPCRVELRVQRAERGVEGL